MKQYIGANFIIDCLEQSITVSGETQSVRPKTFQLLVALIEQPGEVVSKQQLLALIWDDVHVEEHVIVQSIAELRKAFHGQTVIKTLPRKGYCWVATIETRQIALNQVIKSSSVSKGRQYKIKRKTLLLAALFISSLLITASVVVNLKTKDDPTSQTVFILPTINRMMDSKFDWVSLGIMDTLISQAQDHNQIMPLDHVLSSMRLANMQRVYDNEQIERLAQITGAHTVISSELSRRLGEFQLVYHFRQKNRLKRSVLLEKSLDDLIQQFAQVVGEETVFPASEVNISNSPFNHELFVEAIAQSRQGNQSSAVMLLKSLLSIEPNNIEAHLTLVDWLQYRGDYEQALKYSGQALSILADNAPEKSSFYYRHGYSLYRLNDIKTARNYSDKLKQSLRYANNPLYSGYSFQLEGELYFAMQDYDSAKQAFDTALGFFNSVGHSIGLTTVHILIANCYGKLGDAGQRQTHLNSARVIVEKYQLESLLRSFKIELPEK